MKRACLIALAVAAAGFSPFRVEERNIREGNERLASGDPAAALRRYDAAEKAAGARAEIEYDRGNALHRMGRAAEAREAWRRSLGRGPPSLSSRASQNVGTALAAEGDRNGAIAAFVEALRQDPKNEDARFDLEVLLRQEEAAQRRREGGEPQSRAGDGRQPSAAPTPGGRSEPDRGAERQSPRGERPEESPPPAAARREQAPGDADPRAAADRDRGSGGRPDGPGPEISRKDAERILDAFRAREQIAPLGRERRSARRADGDRDW